MMNTGCKHSCSKALTNNCSLGKVSADHVQVVNSMFNNALFVLRLTPTFTFISMSDLVKGYESILEDRIQDILSMHPKSKLQWNIRVTFKKDEIVKVCEFSSSFAVYSPEFLTNGSLQLDEKIKTALPTGYAVGCIIHSDLIFRENYPIPTTEKVSRSGKKLRALIINNLIIRRSEEALINFEKFKKDTPAHATWRRMVDFMEMDIYRAYFSELSPSILTE